MALSIITEAGRRGLPVTLDIPWRSVNGKPGLYEIQGFLESLMEEEEEYINSQSTNDSVGTSPNPNSTRSTRTLQSNIEESNNLHGV